MSNPAVVFAAPGRVEIGDLPMPDPGPGEVQMLTERSGISAGTEGWILRNQFTWSPTPYPCVPGYQQAGRITALGPGVSGWRVGQRVMAVGGDWSGQALAAFWGGHAQRVNVPLPRLFALPEAVSHAAAASLVVAQVGYNAASRPALAAGDWVVVYGDGLIGQFGAQAARARGARVILVGHRPERLALAAAHSADAAVDNREGDVAREVAGHVGAGGVAAVIDTVQSEAAQREYQPLLRPGRGQVVYSGFTPAKAWADMGRLQQEEITAYFVAGWTRPRMQATLDLMAGGQMRVEPLLTHHVPATRAAEMYRMILEKSEPFLGIVLQW